MLVPGGTAKKRRFQLDHLQSEQSDQPAETSPRAEWAKPEVVRLDAGSAEQGDVILPDGNVNS